MRSRLVPAVLASVLMVSSSLAAWKMTPVIKMADSRARGRRYSHPAAVWRLVCRQDSHAGSRCQ